MRKTHTRQPPQNNHYNPSGPRPNIAHEAASEHHHQDTSPRPAARRPGEGAGAAQHFEAQIRVGENRNLDWLAVDDGEEHDINEQVYEDSLLDRMQGKLWMNLRVQPLNNDEMMLRSRNDLHCTYKPLKLSRFFRWLRRVAEVIVGDEAGLGTRRLHDEWLERRHARLMHPKHTFASAEKMEKFRKAAVHLACGAEKAFMELRNSREERFLARFFLLDRTVAINVEGVLRKERTGRAEARFQLLAMQTPFFYLLLLLQILSASRTFSHDNIRYPQTVMRLNEADGFYQWSKQVLNSPSVWKLWTRAVLEGNSHPEGRGLQTDARGEFQPNHPHPTDASSSRSATRRRSSRAAKQLRSNSVNQVLEKSTPAWSNDPIHAKTLKNNQSDTSNQSDPPGLHAFYDLLRTSLLVTMRGLGMCTTTSEDNMQMW